MEMDSYESSAAVKNIKYICPCDRFHECIKNKNERKNQEETQDTAEEKKPTKEVCSLKKFSSYHLALTLGKTSTY